MKQDFERLTDGDTKELKGELVSSDRELGKIVELSDEDEEALRDDTKNKEQETDNVLDRFTEELKVGDRYRSKQESTFDRDISMVEKKLTKI